jgi:DNA-binding MarR family transcriptional regulator
MLAQDPAAADLDQVTDLVLTASRALIAVAARGLARAEQRVSLAQYRVLVVIASHGPLRTVDLAATLAVNPSTATRLCDHLVARRLLRRERATANRREERMTLSTAGRQLVEQVTVRRREEISRIDAAIPPNRRALVVEALRALAAAAGEIPERDWALAWDGD